MGRIIRALSADGSAFCAVTDTADIVEELRRIHQSSPVGTAAAGRLATAGVMMGSLLKAPDDQLTLRVNGGGEAGNIIVKADYRGNVKCSMDNPGAGFDYPLRPLKQGENGGGRGKLDVGRYVGREGFLTVIKDLGLKEPYVTNSPLITGEIGEDIAAYFAYSEQIPTVCALGVLVKRDYTVKHAGGLLIQLLPPIIPEYIDRLEQNTLTLPPITALLAGGKTLEDILDIAMKGMDAEILDEWEVAYHCGCSREKTADLLATLSAEDLSELAADKSDIEVCCHYCDKKYVFTADEVAKLGEAG
jgi:molecular chaperone Hsp33